MELRAAGHVEAAMNRCIQLVALVVVFVAAACASPAAAAGAGSPALVVQVVRLQSVGAAEVAKVVQETLADGSPGSAGFKVVAQSEQNALVLSGTQAQVGQALELVARLDVPPVR